MKLNLNKNKILCTRMNSQKVNMIFTSSLTLKKVYFNFPTFNHLKKKKISNVNNEEMNFKKLQKTRRKTIKFIHKHIVLLVLMLIIVIHHFLYESTTYINTKIK